MLQLSDVSKSYAGGIRALSGINLDDPERDVRAARSEWGGQVHP